MKTIIRVILATALSSAVFCCAPFAFGQGSLHRDVVFNRMGQPMAGASVALCTANPGLNPPTPCASLASLYSDQTLTTPVANPQSTDGYGNVTLYAAPGFYWIEVYGYAISTHSYPVLLPAGAGANANAFYVTANSTNAPVNYEVLTAGANVTVTPNAGAHTITVAASGGVTPVVPGNDMDVIFNQAGTEAGSDQLEWDYHAANQSLKVTTTESASSTSLLPFAIRTDFTDNTYAPDYPSGGNTTFQVDQYARLIARNSGFGTGCNSTFSADQGLQVQNCATAASGPTYGATIDNVAASGTPDSPQGLKVDAEAPGGYTVPGNIIGANVYSNLNDRTTSQPTIGVQITPGTTKPPCSLTGVGWTNCAIALYAARGIVFAADGYVSNADSRINGVLTVNSCVGCGGVISRTLNAQTSCGAGSGSSFSTCSSTYTWPVAFADVDYDVQCTPTAKSDERVFVSTANATDAATFEVVFVNTGSTVNKTITVNCTGIHN